MKKTQILLITIIVSFSSKAQDFVNMDEAREAAAFFASKENLAVHQDDKRIDTSDIYPIIDDGDTLLFLYPVGQYFIIVSRLKCFPPILGYFDSPDSSNHLSDLISDNYFVQRYCYYSKKAIENKNDYISHQWDNLFKNKLKNSNSIIIDTLLTTQWGQTYSNSCVSNNAIEEAYNYYIPDSCSDCQGSHCPVGCVAVAMGQIMKYWTYPIIQYDKSAEHQFDWCNMPDRLCLSNTNYQKERNAIARLLADCGAACDMSYCYMNNCQSFAWPIDARNALVETFGYSSDADLKRRFWYSDKTWKQMIIDDLTNKYPILYSSISTPEDGPARGKSGHAFVCDGYKEEYDLFHFNLGWRGKSNGWYNINNLVFVNGNDTNDYNHFERAIFKLHPPTNDYRDICNYQLSLFNYYYWFYVLNANETPLPNNNIPIISAILYSAPESNTTPASWRTIPAGATAEYVAHKEVILLPGFTAEYGSDFTARIEPCDACEERMVKMDVLTDNDDWQDIDTLQQEMRLYRKGDTTILFQQSELTLFPNPATGTITIQTTNLTDNIQLFDIAGHSVYRWYVESRTDNSTTLNIANIPTGNYILRIQTSDGKTHIGRFAKK